MDILENGSLDLPDRIPMQIFEARNFRHRNGSLILSQGAFSFLPEFWRVDQTHAHIQGLRCSWTHGSSMTLRNVDPTPGISMFKKITFLHPFRGYALIKRTVIRAQAESE